VRALVTGGAGFLGSRLVSRLRDAGWEVSVPRRRDTDLVDAAAVRELFATERPEVVFHLAAEVGGIGANQKNPGRFWYANLAMGMHVLEESRRAEIDKLVMVGTVCSYPKHCAVPFKEADLWNGYPEETNAPYGVAKKALFAGASAYREQYGLNSACLLPVNLYGPGDSFDLSTSHVIPALIRKMSDARAQDESNVILWGDGSPTREFLFVDDCVDAVLLAFERYHVSDPLNIGSGREISIRDLAGEVADVVGYPGTIEWDVTRPNGQPRRRLDTSRAEREIGFRASTTLRDGLEVTAAWYEAYARPRVVSG
jgi:GDP-L-fucose synthase